MRILDIISEESLEYLLRCRQKGLCASCGDALDEEVAIVKKRNSQNLDDYKLVCKGYCQLKDSLKYAPSPTFNQSPT